MTEIIRISSFLRFALVLDATVSLISAFLLILGGNYLAKLLGLTTDFIFYAGLSLFPFIGLLIYTATRKSISKTFVWLIIALNLIWTIDSFLLLISGYVTPTTFGFIFVIFQAIGVLIFADLEFIGMRKSEVIVFKDAKEAI